jgi:glycosyltransferase involved in cell wall biosynthesis
MNGAETTNKLCRGGTEHRRVESRLDVWMYDPWCRTPWYTAALARALASRGHDVRLVCPSYLHEPTYFHDEGLIPRPGLLDFAAQPACKKFRQPARLAEYVINTTALGVASALSAPQILHQQQCVLLERGWKTELAFLQWCRRRGIRVVHTVHNLLPHLEKSFHRALYREFYHLADALICHDDDAALAMNQQFGVSRDRITVVPHGPLFSELPPLSPQECRNRLGLEGGQKIFLALGVLARYKGLDILLEAWADLVLSLRPHPLPLLVIAGNGAATEMHHIRRRAANLGLTKETLRLDLRYIRATEVPIYQHAADALVFPYRDITTSGALLTGLNYSKPIIASDLPPFGQYLISNVNAILVDPGSRRELFGALAAMLEPSCYARLQTGSLNNRSLLVQWEEIGAQVANVYSALPSQNSKSRMCA